MPLPTALAAQLALPAIAAPMFLASGPELVVEVCRSGLIGTFPALNQRTTEGLSNWLSEIAERLEATAAAPYGINLIVHRSNPRVAADLEQVVAHKVPLVITSLGAVPDVVDAVHGYGGLVFHDVINRRHAEKAAEAGVDGIIAICAGAGGHGGTLSPFALLSEIREFFTGTLVLGGAISTGAHIAAARVMGADLAYLGTRFIATREALAPDGFKAMVREARASDIVYTAAISGISGNYLRPSIVAAGLDPEQLEGDARAELEYKVKAWRDVWSAGQGVGAISDSPPAAELCRRLVSEYRAALRMAETDPFGG